MHDVAGRARNVAGAAALSAPVANVDGQQHSGSGGLHHLDVRGEVAAHSADLDVLRLHPDQHVATAVGARGGRRGHDVVADVQPGAVRVDLRGEEVHRG